MKRILTILAGLAVSVSLMAQAQIITKKEKLSDFTLKTLKVALPGNEILDAALRDAVKISWQITPYEFCTLEEDEKLKKSKDYYFMVPVKSVYKKTKLPGIMMLTVVKGATGEKLDDMLEVATIPVCPAENPTGREAAFLPMTCRPRSGRKNPIRSSHPIPWSSMRIRRMKPSPTAYPARWSAIPSPRPSRKRAPCASRC